MNRKKYVHFLVKESCKGVTFIVTEYIIRIMYYLRYSCYSN